MLRLSFFCAALAIALAGCQGPSYVNIPAQPGDVAGNDPNSDVVREVVAEAVRGLLLEVPLDAPVAISLPAGSSVLSHADIARRVGEQAVSPHAEDVEPATQIDVRQVRVRGNMAEVDVLAPGRGGVPRLVTISLNWVPFSGWSAEGVRTWRAGAQDVLLRPEANAPVEMP